MNYELNKRGVQMCFMVSRLKILILPFNCFQRRCAHRISWSFWWFSSSRCAFIGICSCGCVSERTVSSYSLSYICNPASGSMSHPPRRPLLREDCLKPNDLKVLFYFRRATPPIIITMQDYSQGLNTENIFRVGTEWEGCKAETASFAFGEACYQR